MRLLLDTHVWLWGSLDRQRLSASAERALTAEASALHLSPISTWETLMLARKGRVLLPPSPLEWVRDALRQSRLTTCPVTHAIARRSESLEGFGSADPADRFLVATALEHQLVLVTADAAMHAFEPLEVLW